MREDQADQLIAAVTGLTAAILGKGGTTTGGASAGGATTSGGGGAKISFDMVKAAVYKVKEEKGTPAAQKIIKDAGKAPELAKVKEPQYKAIMDACKALLAEPDDAEADAGEDTL